MKVAIISEFQKRTVNYGNNLQAYALNLYLHMHFPFAEVDTLWFRNSCKKHITSPFGTLKKIHSRIMNAINIGRFRNKNNSLNVQLVRKRLKTFEKFQKKISLCQNAMTWGQLKKSNYDIYIVGSDVVWAQERYFVNRIKFLRFKTTRDVKRVAYAASFGCNWIPKENIHYIKKCLKEFDMLSLREVSAVQMLKLYGINDAVHVLDPTLLIPKDEWEKLETKPDDVETESFVFVYLLGTDKMQRERITAWSRKNNLLIITIPYANGVENECDSSFGDIKLNNCSPEEWIWLIHHAEYIITDSFHGIVFSTIFEKRFFAMIRDYAVDINVRLDDFLETIHQNDKMILNCAFKPADEYKWDYELIKRILSEKIRASEKFLEKAIL